MPNGDGQRYVEIRRKVDQQKQISDEEKRFISTRRHHLQGDNVDILRHTYGTNLHYKCKSDLRYVTAQMGNSDKVFYRHYKGMLDRPNAWKEFFKLSPSAVLEDG